jgi:transcriptional regulator with XRE-family HTH domain
VKSKSLAATAVLRATVGSNIRRLRSYRGWSQAQLAAEAGLSAAMIGTLENGRGNPRVTTLAAVAKALGVAPISLLAEPIPRASS